MAQYDVEIRQEFKTTLRVEANSPENAFEVASGELNDIADNHDDVITVDGDHLQYQYEMTPTCTRGVVYSLDSSNIRTVEHTIDHTKQLAQWCYDALALMLEDADEDSGHSKVLERILEFLKYLGDK